MAVTVLFMDQDSAKPFTAAVSSTNPTGSETPDHDAIHTHLDDVSGKSAKKFNIRGPLVEVFNDFLKVLSKEKSAFGHSTGLSELDRFIGGLRPGKMFVIASRPAMGKTSLMLNIAEHVCIDQKVPTLIFSAELTAFKVVQRMLFSRANFVTSRLWRHDHQLTKDDIRPIQHAAIDLANANLFVEDCTVLSIDALRATARRLKQENDIGFIAIDDLHCLKSDSPQAKHSHEREIADVSAGIKSLAKELGIPILVLAQLNRKPENRNGYLLGVPRLSDLRDSGAIENDADTVGLLYRPSYYAETDVDKEVDAGNAYLIVAKNRDGDTGDVPLLFIAEVMRFKDHEDPMDDW
jgi:replicative DNA helicase